MRNWVYILRGGRAWRLPGKTLRRYRRTFPLLDIDSELIKAQSWIADNKSRRKTENGMKRFLTNWLLKADRDRVRDSVSRGATDPKSLSRELDKVDMEAEKIKAISDGATLFDIGVE